MDYWIARLRPIRTTAWRVGLLVLSSEKAITQIIEWKYRKGILRILNALFSAYLPAPCSSRQAGLLDLQQSSMSRRSFFIKADNPFIQ